MATTGRPRDLAQSLRRGADRLSMIRLRVNRAIAESAGEDRARVALDSVRPRWTRELDPEIGRVARGMRVAAESLEQRAQEAERAGGRRMGGYGGAGYLGSGDRAVEQIPAVTSFRGSSSGASIGGFPLAPATPQPAFLPHPSQTLGEPTPDYEDEE